MPYIIIIERNGNIRQHNLKDTKLNEQTLYKKIGLKVNTHFECIYSDESTLRIYGKKVGKKNFLNSYTLPCLHGTPIYGTCILLRISQSLHEDGSILLDNFTTEDFYKYIDMSSSPPVISSPLPVTPPVISSHSLDMKDSHSHIETSLPSVDTSSKYTKSAKIPKPPKQTSVKKETILKNKNTMTYESIPITLSSPTPTSPSLYYDGELTEEEYI